MIGQRSRQARGRRAGRQLPRPGRRAWSTLAGPIVALALLSLTLVLIGDLWAGAVVALAGAGLAALWAT